MEPVDNDLGVGQESPGDVSEASVHVHDDVLHFVPVGEGAKISLNGQGGSVRKDVEHAAIQRVCDDTLKGLAARVALEFVKGEGLRQSLRLGAQSQILCKLPTRREQSRIQCVRQRIYPTAALCAV